MLNFAYFRLDQHDVLTPPFFPIKKDGDEQEPQTPVYCYTYMNYFIHGFGADQLMDVMFPELLKDGSGFDLEPLLKQKILGQD
jgi:arginine utilization protein RocB